MFYYASGDLNFLYIVSVHLRLKRVKNKFQQHIRKSLPIKQLQNSVSKGA